MFLFESWDKKNEPVDGVRVDAFKKALISDSGAPKALSFLPCLRYARK